MKTPSWDHKRVFEPNERQAVEALLRLYDEPTDREAIALVRGSYNECSREAKFRMNSRIASWRQDVGSDELKEKL